MKRIALTDQSGRWFDRSKAECYEEESLWNGNNHISCATGSQWGHEELYRTASGRWILHNWSQWQGSTPSYTEIDDEEAAVWFSRQGMEVPERLASAQAVLEV